MERGALIYGIKRGIVGLGLVLISIAFLGCPNAFGADGGSSQDSSDLTGTVTTRISLADVSLDDTELPSGETVVPAQTRSFKLLSRSSSGWKVLSVIQWEGSAASSQLHIQRVSLPYRSLSLLFEGVLPGRYERGELRLDLLNGNKQLLVSGYSNEAVTVSGGKEPQLVQFSLLPYLQKHVRNESISFSLAPGSLQYARVPLFYGERSILEVKPHHEGLRVFLADEAGHCTEDHGFSREEREDGLRFTAGKPESSTRIVYIGLLAGNEAVELSVEHRVSNEIPSKAIVFDFHAEDSADRNRLEQRGWSFTGDSDSPCMVRSAVDEDTGDAPGFSGMLRISGEAPVAKYDFGGSCNRGQAKFRIGTITSYASGSIELVDKSGKILFSIDLPDQYKVRVTADGGGLSEMKIPGDGSNSPSSSEAQGFSDFSVRWNGRDLSWDWVHWARGADGTWKKDYQDLDNDARFIGPGVPQGLRFCNRHGTTASWRRILLANLSLEIDVEEVPDGPIIDPSDRRAMERVRDNLVKIYCDIQVRDSEVDDLLASQRSDGSFPGFLSDNLSAAHDHLDALYKMAFAYRWKESRHYKSEVLAAGIIHGIQFWLQDGDYHDPNWWHNYIGFQSRLAPTALLMSDTISIRYPQLQDEIVAYLYRSWEGYLLDRYNSGTANRMDFAYNTAVGAAIAFDLERFEDSLDVMTETFTVRSNGEEGIQPDMSWQEHGPQLHSMTYGAVWLSGALRSLELVSGTRWENASAIDTLSRYYLEGVGRMTYGRWFDYNAGGRGISRVGSHSLYDEDGNSRALRRLERFIALDPPDQRELKELLERRRSEGNGSKYPLHVNTSFWNSEFMTHIRKGYYTSVRMVSNRTSRNERGNGEGIRNRKFGDGITFYLVHGDEYDYMPALWDYTRLPGITAELGSETCPESPWGGTARNRFAGAASDGTYGVAAMKVDFDGVKADKAWFLFDDAVVATGSGIAGPGNIITSVNQSRHAGRSIHLAERGIAEKQLSMGTDTLQSGWVWHREIGYIFPSENKQSVVVDSQNVSGNYSDVGTGEQSVSEPVISLWLAHGTSPTEEGYEYIVLPDARLDETRSFARNNPLLLRKTNVGHAVLHQEKDLLGLAFFQSGEIQVREGLIVRSDSPALVFINRNNGTITVSDPLHAGSMINLDIAWDDRARSVFASLSTGGESGKSVTLQW